MDRWQKYLEAKCDQLASFFHERLNSATLKDTDGHADPNADAHIMQTKSSHFLSVFCTQISCVIANWRLQNDLYEMDV